MRCRSALLALVLAICLPAAWLTGAAGAESSRQTLPFHPRILEASQASQTAAIMRRVALSYAPHLSQRDREVDFFQKVALAKRLLGLGRLVELRHRTLALLTPG